MSKIFYSTPYADGNIGKGINDFIENLPNDCWVVIRDSDTLFLTPTQQKQIQDIVDKNPDYDLLGCRTNRLKSQYQAIYDMFWEDSILKHIQVAKERETLYYGEITPLPEKEVVAGMFMLFRKSLWDKFKFKEHSIQFDMIFSEQIKNSGGKLGICEGIYLFHLYRYTAENPFVEIEHIRNCHKF